MSEHAHRHAHPSAAPVSAAAPSLLRASAGQRVLGALVLVVLLWAAAFWAMG